MSGSVYGRAVVCQVVHGAPGVAADHENVPRMLHGGEGDQRVTTAGRPLEPAGRRLPSADPYRRALYVGVPAWGSRNHVGLNQETTGATSRQLTLSQNGTRPGHGIFTTVCDAPGRGPVVVTGTRAVPFTPYSSTTSTQGTSPPRLRPETRARRCC